MLSEHLLYSLAIAIVFRAVYRRLTGRDYWWIIVASAFIPDLDLIADTALRTLGITVMVFGAPINHGHFHNILVMLFYAVTMAFLLHPLGIRLMDSFVFALAGFAAHMLEDAIVANPAYPFLYPLTVRRFGIGFFSYRADIFAVADREVLIAGIILVIIALAVRRALAGDAATKRRLR